MLILIYRANWDELNVIEGRKNRHAK
ncbi:hypothetical protein PSSM4_070.1 [Prochlorococcus phage P-SSM4]|uniref:Uncharacterized protein n=1 Tax=Prochlorococcus phage P-SSM4 TaxID=268747 RepID=E2PTZ2_BPPRS|nr:hypothetical protein PSSM4_070.1 [Prochlorococcus phage P-SSM4]ADK66288.1 hypothetical protein PSSM4_070.1 [Prochlorococcus phage P-SSM4]